MFHKFYVFMVFTTVIICASPSIIVQRILGGSDAPRNLSPYQVSLQNFKGVHICGGVIVSEKTILTAAHCVTRILPSLITIVVGIYVLKETGKKYDVKSAIEHPNYNSTSREHDIAVVLPEKNIKFSDKVKSISLNLKFMDKDDSVLLTGFGAHEPHGENTCILQAIKMKVLDLETCRYAYRFTKDIYDSMMCTYVGFGQGTCHGDSGGPLIADGALVGLVSWGIPCAVGFPDVHTRISYYTPWLLEIDKNINL